MMTRLETFEVLAKIKPQLKAEFNNVVFGWSLGMDPDAPEDSCSISIMNMDEDRQKEVRDSDRYDYEILMPRSIPFAEQGLSEEDIECLRKRAIELFKANQDQFKHVEMDVHELPASDEVRMPKRDRHVSLSRRAMRAVKRLILR